MALHLDGYVRVSKVGGRDQTDGFISPDIQEQAIREWAERNGASITIQPHELNVSGGTMDRPVFNRVMERIRSGESDGVVVFKLDRFARTLLGAVGTLEELGKNGASFASATEPALDYTTPSGRAFVQQLFVFAEFTRSTLKESWATSQRYAIERGIHISPNGFFGYDSGSDRRLVPNEHDAPVAREMFLRRAGGEGWGSLADWLNDVAPKTDGNQWTGLSVARTCSKRVFVGEASRYVVQDKDGRGPVVNPNAHPAIVTEAEWQAAQANPRIAKGTHKDGTPYPLLSGLVRCAGCRYLMSQGTAFDQQIYRCRHKHASGTCPNPARISATALEAHVDSVIAAQFEGLMQEVADDADRDRLTAELAQARGDLDDFRRDRDARRKLGAEWHEWLDTYLTAVRELEGELATIDNQFGNLDVDGERLTAEVYRELDQDSRREVIAAMMDTVMVKPSRGRGQHTDPLPVRTRILWRGQGPTDLPRRRVVNVIKSFDFDGEDKVATGILTSQHST